LTLGLILFFVAPHRHAHRPGGQVDSGADAAGRSQLHLAALAPFRETENVYSAPSVTESGLNIR
tara:strand:+ start:38 stop:229 length:192 start_codon:yes stop_codon:yes gene_type:complete